MMLATSLTLLPPPSSSLLPPSTDNATNNQSLHSASMGSGGGATNGPHTQQHHRRHQNHHKHNRNPRSTLAILSADERTISQRKLAIAMYGFSWLKPAGCAKTMLGRREEEVEREEVERQLREVEMQERIAAEVEDEERRRGAIEETGEGERDLDDDVPDADDMIEGEVDLDDEIPSAEEDIDEEDGLGEDEEEGNGDLDEGPEDVTRDVQWTYDTRRDPDTDSGDEQETANGVQIRDRRRVRFPGHSIDHRNVGIPGSEYDVDEREAEALANAMLDEDEIGEAMMDEQEIELEGFAERDLDDDVPEAEADSGGWEHTDTELEDDDQGSEMDISILPPTEAHIQTRTQETRSRRSNNHDSSIGARIVSGNAALQQMQMQLQSQSQSRATSGSGIYFQTPEPTSHTPDQHVHHGDTGIMSSDVQQRQYQGPHEINNIATTFNAAASRGPTSPRRNLFNLHGANRAAQSSSRLFTPSPGQSSNVDEHENDQHLQQPANRRSGRAITTTTARVGTRTRTGGRGGNRFERDSLD